MRRFSVLAAGIAALGIASGTAYAQSSIKIGYVVAKTGQNAAGTAITVTPNYQMWVDEVNKSGGILVKTLGKKLPIEVVEYDDRSTNEEAVRATERLATQDKVDFILPPWGTATNLAVGPTLHKYGYPHLAVTAVTEHAPELAKRWPRSFWFLGTGSQGADALAGLLSSLKKDGKIGDSVAMVSVADGFGIDLATAARKSFKTADLKLVYDKAYPVGTQDFAPLINEAKNTKADTFVAFSYPPETFGIAEQSKILGFNPKVYYLGVGTAFVQFGQKLGPDAQGILGVGGVNADSPLFKAYAEKHKAFTKGQEPDRWASAVVYASLQMLQQAIERVGSLDKDAIAKEIASGEFDTVVGTVKMKDNIRQGIWWVGQWQDGEFHGIAPANLEGARKLMFPKPDWK